MPASIHDHLIATSDGSSGYKKPKISLKNEKSTKEEGLAFK